jgi:hypothetical protein
VKNKLLNAFSTNAREKYYKTKYFGGGVKQGRNLQKIVAVAAAACVFPKTTSAKPQREAESHGVNKQPKYWHFFQKTRQERPKRSAPQTHSSHRAGDPRGNPAGQVSGAAQRSSPAEQPRGAPRSSLAQPRGAAPWSNNAKQSKAKQSKAKQRKATQRKAKQGEAKQSKAKQGEAKQREAKQS